MLELIFMNLNMKVYSINSWLSYHSLIHDNNLSKGYKEFTF